MNWRNDLTTRVVVPSADVIGGEMARVLEDGNKLHKSLDEARRYTYSKIPAMGVFPMIHAEQQMFRAAQGLNGHMFRGVEFTLRTPCFAGDNLRFEFGEGNFGSVYRVGVGKFGGDELAMEISGIDFAPEFEKFDEKRVNNILHEFEYNFDGGKLENISACLGTSKREKPSSMIIGSALPSALIKAGNQRGTPIDGVYHRASFRIFGIPEAGKVEVKLKVVGHRPIGGGTHAYTFRGFCYQNGMPLLEGDLGVFSRTDLKVEPVRE